jgi:RNA polymerase sigma factor (sigma-70 family)
MSVSSMNRVMQRIRQAVVDADDPCEADADLIARFLSLDDSHAVGVLIRRHAPMVWGVCRRILLDHHNAEDAFQATFLVLLRKANTIKPRSMVGNWLHGVAFQTALKARAMTMKRSTREKSMAILPEPASKAKGDHPMLEFLDEELNRLPDKYRVVLVLCDLQGKTRAEAARELGWAEGTVASRLARGRQMLANRLGRHGTAVSAGTIGALLANSVASAAPASVLASTVQAAITIVSAKTLAAAGLSQQVITLADGVVKTMLLSKLKVVGVILTIAVLACFGIGSAIQMYAGEQGPAATPPAAGATDEKKGEPPQKREKEAFTAWGKEIGGLQAGLGFRPGEKRGYSQGETVRVVARIRNVGKEAVDFKHIWAFFVENPPKITDADGKMVQLPNYRTRDQGLHMPRSSNVAPGKEVELYEWTFDLQPNGENSSRSFIHGTGKHSLQCERIVGPTWLNPDHPNPTLSKLGTGKLELEIKSQPPAATDKKARQKQESGDQTAKKFWAGMSVNKPLYRAGQNTNLLQFNFALINESGKVIDPKISGYPRLIVNGEELDLTRIPGVGPRDGRFKALPPGDNLQFGMGAGQFFDKPGVYRVYWQGEEFRSNEIVFRVMK